MRQDKSTDQQLTEIDSFCKQHGLIHRHKFVDDAKSGGNTAGRDAFNQMMELYADPETRPNGLILWNYARFARDIDDAQYNKIRLRQWGIIIHSLNDQVPEGEYGRVIEFLIDVANEEKRKQTSTDAKRGLKDLVEKYGCVPGTPPAGFMRTPINLGPRRDKTEHIAHRWDPDPNWIPRIQRAFQMKATGATLIQIHKETHIYTSLNSYRTFFNNQLYIGTLIFGKLAIEHYCPPIIDLPTWIAVQKILTLHANRQHVSSPTHLHPRRKSETATYLLSGIIACNRCGSPLYGMTSQQRDGTNYLRYACTRRTRRRDCDFTPIPAKPLETEVIKHTSAFFQRLENIQALIDEDASRAAQISIKNKTTARDLQKQLVPLRRSISNITKAIRASGHSKSLLKDLAHLELQETELLTQLQTLQTETQQNRPTPYTEQEILTLSQQIPAILQTTTDPSTKRKILLAIINNITIDRTPTHALGTITINLPKVEPSPPNKHQGEGDVITALSYLHSVGAPTQTRSIDFQYSIRTKKTPS
jgi:site-specific DNA recombinase